MSVDTVTIDGRVVGDGRVFVIAELSANHGGSIAKAKETIHAAADAGADAVKLQTYRPESITLESDQAVFRVGDGNLWSGRTLFDLYREAMTPWEWHAELFAEARNLGLSIFSSPFDFDAVDFLEELDAPAYKIASFEILDHALIAKAAATGKPLVISTGMATAEEIDEAVSVARSNGSGGLVLLHCNSTYPAEPGQMDLATIADIARGGRVRWACRITRSATPARSLRLHSVPPYWRSTSRCVDPTAGPMARSRWNPASSPRSSTRFARPSRPSAACGTGHRHQRSGRWRFAVRCSSSPTSRPESFSPWTMFDRSVPRVVSIRNSSSRFEDGVRRSMWHVAPHSTGR